MKYIRLIKSNKEWSVHKTDNRQKPYWYISGPNGVYKDADGNTYKFDSYEDALEEVEYLKAEHKYSKKASNVDNKQIINDILNNFEKITGISKKDVFNHTNDNDAPIFDNDQIEKTYPAIRKYVLTKYNVDIASMSDFGEMLDDALLYSNINASLINKKSSSNSLNISNEVSMATGIIDEMGGFSSDEESPQDFVDAVKNIARKINNFLDTLDGDQFNVGNLKEATWQFSDRAWVSSDDFEECLDDLQYEFSNEGINLII